MEYEVEGSKPRGRPKRTWKEVVREDCQARKLNKEGVKKCMEYEVEGSRPRGRPKRTWKEVVQEECQARKLNKEDAVDRCKWRKVITEVR